MEFELWSLRSGMEFNNLFLAINNAKNKLLNSYSLIYNVLKVFIKIMYFVLVYLLFENTFKNMYFLLVISKYVYFNINVYKKILFRKINLFHQNIC